MAVMFAEGLLHLTHLQMDRRCNDMAGCFMAKLDDIFPEVCLYRGNIVRFEVIVEPDFLGDHGLALGHGAGVQ